MLAGPLPETADYRQLMNEGASLTGTMAVSRFTRLNELLVSDEGELEVSVSFSARRKKRCVVIGHAKGTVRMACQRCLESMPVPIEVRVRLNIVADENELLELELEQDGLVVDGPRLQLTEVFEDELLVSVPMSPVHDTEACQIEEQESQPAPEGETHRPFANLADLMKSDSDKN